MGAICNQWAHFGHSGNKHSECAQFLTITHIVDPLWRTFKIYPIFNHWVHCGQVLSVPTMYSPCAHWVYVSLSPVWETVSHINFLKEFNLLHNIHQDICEKPWSQLAIWELMKLSQQVRCAHGEIDHCHIAVCHLYIAIHDKDNIFEDTLS